jgi:hypothetical protein
MMPAALLILSDSFVRVIPSRTDGEEPHNCNAGLLAHYKDKSTKGVYLARASW